jgi:hypothetical protein
MGSHRNSRCYTGARGRESSVRCYAASIKEIISDGVAGAIASLRLLIESVRRTSEYASDIAEVVLGLNVESILK